MPSAHVAASQELDVSSGDVAVSQELDVSSGDAAVSQELAVAVSQEPDVLRNRMWQWQTWSRENCRSSDRWLQPLLNVAVLYSHF